MDEDGSQDNQGDDCVERLQGELECIETRPATSKPVLQSTFASILQITCKSFVDHMQKARPKYAYTFAKQNFHNPCVNLSNGTCLRWGIGCKNHCCADV